MLLSTHTNEKHSQENEMKNDQIIIALEEKALQIGRVYIRALENKAPAKIIQELDDDWKRVREAIELLRPIL
jgi:hypothetical protein